MPRYYFDIHDGIQLCHDEVGVEYSDALAMRNAAVEVLPNIVRHDLPKEDQRHLTVRVRDVKGRYLFQASLSLQAEWFDGPPTA